MPMLRRTRHGELVTMTCEHCQQQLLPYLYDLLDPDDRAGMAAHLEACADCGAALKLAQQQQSMFAEAVKEPNAQIEFKAPVKAIPISTAPTIVMHDRPRRRFVLFNRWAAAAAILFILFCV